MATEPKPVACPVCGEAFAAPPPRCFRCETDLSLWWRLDESLLALSRSAKSVAPPEAQEPAPAEPLRPGRGRVWLLPVILMSGLLGAFLLHLESTRPRVGEPVTDGRSHSPPPPASAGSAQSSPVASPRPTLRYVVQPGDSLWRIAASLKGDGRRWPELLAEGDGVDPARLRPGQELRLRLD